MKNILNASGILLVILFVACAEIPIENYDSESEIVTRASAESETREYYWSGGHKIYLDADPTEMVVGFDNDKDMTTFIADIPQESQSIGRSMILVKVKDEKVKNKISTDKISRKMVKRYEYSDGNVPFIMTGDILLQPKEGVTIEDILEKCEIDAESANNTDIGVVIHLKDWSNILSTANMIYESGMVDWCHPDFIAPIERMTNDQYFQYQYYLKNTGQTGGKRGIDINVESAWALSTGAGIRVAVIDDGVEAHDDLGNRLLNGYTPLNPTTGNGRPTAQTGPSIGHGQACAGIIAASHNSGASSYTAGVAPNVQIVPVNIFHTWQQGYDVYGNLFWYSTESAQNIASGIEYAWNPNKGNADVISNSWRAPQADVITQQINNAVSQGRLRNGSRRGCIVVFASGNSRPYGPVSFPASLPNVIAVGAVNKNGSVWDYSCRSNELDIVAPSGNTNMSGDIYTLDRMGTKGYETGNYTSRFGGTSAACPQVAGVAALMLSANPNLTWSQVHLVIEKSAQKAGGYNYTTQSGHNSGTWCKETGYGLINARQAVYDAIMFPGPKPKPATPGIYCSGATQVYLSGYDAPVFWARPGTSVEFRIDNTHQYGSSVTFEWLVPSGTHTGRSYTYNIPSGSGTGMYSVWCIAKDGGEESDPGVSYLYISSVSPMSLPVKEQKDLVEQLKMMHESEKFVRSRVPIETLQAD